MGVNFCGAVVDAEDETVLAEGENAADIVAELQAALRLGNIPEITFTIVEEKHSVVGAIAAKADAGPLVAAGQEQIGVAIAVDVGGRNGVNGCVLRFLGKAVWAEAGVGGIFQPDGGEGFCF